MSTRTRTKEEIVEAIEAAKREVKHYENRRESMCSHLAALEAELAALPKELVELVVNSRYSDVSRFDVQAKNEEYQDDSCVARVYADDCKRNGINPAHLARFITTYPIVTELMELLTYNDGNVRSLSGKGCDERADLARRYHVAMKGGTA